MHSWTDDSSGCKYRQINCKNHLGMHQSMPFKYLKIKILRPFSVTHLLITYTSRFNGPLSQTTWMSRYQKGRTNLDFTEAKDRSGSDISGSMQVCTSLLTDNHTNTPPLVFFRLDALPAAQPTASKH